MNIYVSNLSPDVTEENLQMVFSAFGRIESLLLARDRFSGVSKEYGFIEMPAQNEALSAIEALKGKNLKGKPLRVGKTPTRFKIHHSGRGRDASRRNLGSKKGGTWSRGRRF